MVKENKDENIHKYEIRRKVKSERVDAKSCAKFLRIFTTNFKPLSLKAWNS